MAWSGKTPETYDASRRSGPSCSGLVGLSPKSDKPLCHAAEPEESQIIRTLRKNALAHRDARGADMSNALTGDFDAVLELNGGTLNRLLATMHQAAAGSSPSVPHIAYFRLGEDRNVPGASGSVAVQIGVPHVQLIHGASNRFRLHVDIRARYRADPGSTPLADIICGRVQAEYRFEDIDPACFGWRELAGSYSWLRVVKDTVSFDGTLRNESSMFSLIGVADEPTVKGRVEKLLATLLDTRFAPEPQPVGKQFRRLRGLAFGDGPAQSGIAMPFDLDGAEPAGNLASINDLFLDGRDFGLAVSRERVMAAIAPEVEPIVGLQRDFHVHGDAGIGGGLEIDYHVRLDAAAVEWAGPLAIPLVSLSGGLIRVRVSGVGWASRLYRSGVFNVGSVQASGLRMTFSVEQLLLLGFDEGSERLTVAAFGTPVVSLDYHGPFAGYVTPEARNAIADQVQSRLGGVLAQARQDLGGFTAAARKAPLIDQLRRIDGSAGARFTDAVFRAEGLILRGVIPLSHRYVPQVSFEKTAAGDGFDALESWIPGGRVESFEWTWVWFTNGLQAAPGPPGALSSDDTFTLRRPQGPRNKFGMSLSREQPLPGLDGQGRLCLVIRGVRVDHVTGALTAVTSVRECAKFGYEFTMPYEVSAYARVCDPLRAVAEEPAPEIGVVRLGVPGPRVTASNTLLLSLGDDWDEEAASALRSGLETCRREGAGLLAVVLFREGVLGSGDRELRNRLEELAQGLAAPLMVNEDVRGGWTRTLALPARATEPAWRLITPDGTVSWSHHGRADGELVAAVLDERLIPSAPAGFGHLRTDVDIGGHVPIELVAGRCPPVPLARAGFGGSRLVFVHKDRASAVAQLARPGPEQEEVLEAAPYLAIVMEGANTDEVDALRESWELDIPVFADPNGTLTRGAGVRFSPSTLTLDDRGRLAGSELGVTIRDRASDPAGDAAETQEAS